MERLDHSFEDSFDLDELLAKDEDEKRLEKAKRHLNFTRKRRKIFKIFVKLGLLVLIIIYFIGDISNVKALRISGNVIYSSNQIEKIANISYSSKNILYPSFFIEYLLKKDPLIKNAKVKKTFTGGVYISVEEEKIIGYYQQGDVYYILLGDGSSLEMDDDNINLITSPYINGLSNTQRSELCTIFEKLDKEEISMISEITTYSTSYDQNMLQVVMADGHIVRSTYKGMSLLSSYKDILKGLDSSLQCIYLVEETNSSYSQKCE